MYKGEIYNANGYLQTTEEFETEDEVREDAEIIIDGYINDWIVDEVCTEKERNVARKQFNVDIVEV